MSSDENVPTPFDGDQADADVGSNLDTLPRPSDSESGGGASVADADDGLPTPFDADSRAVADQSGVGSTDDPTPLEGPGADAGSGDPVSSADVPAPDQAPSASGDDGDADNADGDLPRPADDEATG